MQVTTVRNKPKSFAWSYSKLKNFETCPKRSWHLDIAKDIKEPEGEALLWGNAVHKALAERVEKSTPLPKTMAEYEKWAERITAGGNSTILVEQKLAIRKDLSGCSWFDNDAWYRGIGDVIKIMGPVALVCDYKTGKIIEDGSQLALMAACVFAHHPDVQKVRSEFIWLKEDATTRADFARDNMVTVWKGLWPRIESLEHAVTSMTFPAKPGGLCKRYCPVTVCPHHGE
jgi:hypothetical protein